MIDSRWLYVYQMAISAQILQPTLVAFLALLSYFLKIRQFCRFQ